MFTVALTANNAGGTGSRNLTLTIDPPPAGVPVITSPLSSQARVGSPFSYRITADNNPDSFGADGLPDELSVNSASGVISGTPALAREHTITLRANNAAGTGYAVLVLSVQGDSSFSPANDAFANHTVLAGTNLTVTGGNNNATAESGSQRMRATRLRARFGGPGPRPAAGWPRSARSGATSIPCSAFTPAAA